MNNHIKRLMTFTTVIFLSLSPALAPIGSASAEKVTPQPPHLVPTLQRKVTVTIQEKTERLGLVDISLFLKRLNCWKWIVQS